MTSDGVSGAMMMWHRLVISLGDSFSFLVKKSPKNHKFRVSSKGTAWKDWESRCTIFSWPALVGTSELLHREKVFIYTQLNWATTIPKEASTEPRSIDFKCSLRHIGSSLNLAGFFIGCVSPRTYQQRACLVSSSQGLWAMTWADAA